jgi:hypothetical protein
VLRQGFSNTGSGDVLWRWIRYTLAQEGFLAEKKVDVLRTLKTNLFSAVLN